MKNLLVLFLAMSAPLALAAGEGERIENGCQEMLKKDTKNSRPVCECVRKNLELKLDKKELKLIARAYEGDAKAEAELDKEANEALQSFDAEVAEACLADPKFTVDTK